MSSATIAQLDQSRTAKSTTRFPLQPFNEIDQAAECSYLIKGVLPREGLAVVWGPPKCGKSFFVFDLAMHVALGRPYRNRKIQQGSVVYCALEGQAGFGSRAAAFRQNFLTDFADAVPFYLMATPFLLVKEHHDLITAIETQLQADGPVLVILDTLNRSFTGSENSDTDMTEYVRAADAIRDRFNCLVLIVHHCGIEGSRPRGHSSLAGAVDAQLGVQKEADFIEVRLEKMKDGPEGEEIFSRLVPVVVGFDADGDRVSSCIVEPAEPPATSGQRGRRLSKRNSDALVILEEMIAKVGESQPAVEGRSRSVPITQWKEEIFQKGVLNQSATNSREDFRRVKNQLSDRGRIVVENEIVWIPSDPISSPSCESGPKACEPVR